MSVGGQRILQHRTCLPRPLVKQVLCCSPDSEFSQCTRSVTPAFVEIGAQVRRPSVGSVGTRFVAHHRHPELGRGGYHHMVPAGRTRWPLGSQGTHTVGVAGVAMAQRLVITNNAVLPRGGRSGTACAPPMRPPFLWQTQAGCTGTGCCGHPRRRGLGRGNSGQRGLGGLQSDFVQTILRRRMYTEPLLKHRHYVHRWPDEGTQTVADREDLICLSIDFANFHMDTHQRTAETQGK